MSILAKIKEISEDKKNAYKNASTGEFNQIDSILFDAAVRDCEIEFRIISGINIDDPNDQEIDEKIKVKFLKNPKNPSDKVTIVSGLDKELDEQYDFYYKKLKEAKYGLIYKYTGVTYRKVFIYFNKFLKGNFKLDLHKIYIAYIRESIYYDIIDKFNNKVKNGYMSEPDLIDFYDYTKPSKYVIYYSGKEVKKGKTTIIERDFVVESTNSLKPINLQEAGVVNLDRFNLKNSGFWRNQLTDSMKEKLGKAVVFIKTEYENYSVYKDKLKTEKIDEAEKARVEEERREEVARSQETVRNTESEKDDKPPFDEDEKVEIKEEKVESKSEDKGDKPECFGDTTILNVSDAKCSEQCPAFITCVQAAYSK